MVVFECIENCGKCCGMIPLDLDFVDKNKEKFAVQPVEIKTFGQSCAVITADVKCVFLDRTTKKCNIYDRRPIMCQMYGVSKNPDLQCPYLKPNGRPRAEASRKQVERRLDKIMRGII